MIPVLVRGDEIPRLHGDWPQRAEALRLQVMAALPETRSEIINKNQIWQELTDTLQRWSYKKCWYSEAKPTKHGGKFDVDHFRPKLGAVDPWNKRRWDGYPWLAFALDNFRLATVVCNRLEKDEQDETRGKGTLFPLRGADSPIAVNGPGLAAEEPHVALLDPCREGDTAWLSFDEDGRCVCLLMNDPWIARRVERTVDVYNLNHPGFVAGRHDVILYCKSLIAQIELSQKMPANDDREHTLKELEQKLTLMFRADQEYAGAARAYARKCGREWVLQISQYVGPPPYAMPPPPPSTPSPPFAAPPMTPDGQLFLPFAATGTVVLGPRPAMPPGTPKPKKKSAKPAGKAMPMAAPTTPPGPPAASTGRPTPDDR